MNRWWFRSLFNQKTSFEFLNNIISIERNAYSTFNVIFPFTEENIKIAYNGINMNIFLPNMVSGDQLILSSKYSILNLRTLTITQGDINLLFQDLQVNEKLLTFNEKKEYKIELKRSLPYKKQTLQEIKDNPGDELPMRELILTVELTVSKAEVSFLLGHHGERIEQIRSLSCATIKILPIEKRLTLRDLNHPSQIIQQLSITGNKYSVAVALSRIEAELGMFNLSFGRQY